MLASRPLLSGCATALAVAILLAAGKGERLGAEVAKAFAPLAGRPMIEWSLAALASVPAVSQVVVALPDGGVAPPGTISVGGGATRSESVRNALSVAGEGDPVVVHDAARPLATPELFERTLGALEEHGWDGAVAAAPVTDTVKRTRAGRVVAETLDRSGLWAVQTPQAFRRAALERALDAELEVLVAATDDASLVERSGGVVGIVPAPAENLKVTTPLDLRLAEQLIGQR